MKLDANNSQIAVSEVALQKMGGSLFKYFFWRQVSFSAASTNHTPKKRSSD
jgi:hypothetical protein